MALLAALATIACTNPQVEALRQKVEKINSNCPMDLGIKGDLLSIAYDEHNNNVVLSQSTNDEVFGFMLSDSNTEAAKKFMSASLLQRSVIIEDLTLNDLIETKAGLIMKYKATLSHKSAIFRFTFEELEYLKKSPKMSEEELLRMNVKYSLEMQNRALPQNMGDGLIYERVVADGDKMLFVYKANKETIEVLSYNKEYTKQEIVSTFTQSHNDPAILNDLVTAVKLNYSFRFHYYCDEGLFVNIDLSVSEIQAILDGNL